MVEDSALIRERLVTLLRSLPGVKITGQADSASEAIEAITAARPDVVVLDLKLRVGNGFQVLTAIKQQMPGISVVVLTNHATPEYHRKCIEAGAEYFLDKTNEFQQISTILEKYNSGRQ